MKHRLAHLPFTQNIRILKNTQEIGEGGRKNLTKFHQGGRIEKSNHPSPKMNCLCCGVDNHYCFIGLHEEILFLVRLFLAISSGGCENAKFFYDLRTH